MVVLLGGISEAEQGAALVDMIKVLFEEGYDMPCVFELGKYQTRVTFSRNEAKRSECIYF